MFSAMVQLSAPDAVSLTNKPYFHGQRMAESTKRSAVAAGQSTTVGCAHPVFVHPACCNEFPTRTTLRLGK